MAQVHDFPFTANDALRRARIDAGLSPKELAELLGVNYQSVLRWETGAKIPGGKNLARLIEVTGAQWLPDALARLRWDSRCYANDAGGTDVEVAA